MSDTVKTLAQQCHEYLADPKLNSEEYEKWFACHARRVEVDERSGCFVRVFQDGSVQGGPLDGCYPDWKSYVVTKSEAGY